MLNLTPRQKYIKKTFSNAELSEKEIDNLVSKIAELGERVNPGKKKNKYDVWIARETKKDIKVLNRFFDIMLILDWALHTKTDLLKFSFEQAFFEQQKWHLEQFSNIDLKKIKVPEIDQNRIVFKCSDNNHFFYLLNEKDLKFEGQVLCHCVGKKSYRDNLKNGKIIIISLRNSKNIPQFTLEINLNKKMVIHQSGKKNEKSKFEHHKFLTDFFIFSNGFKVFKGKEAISFLTQEIS